MWLAYDLVAGDPAPDGYASCFDADDGSYRVVELPLLRYTVPDPNETDRRRATVPEGDRDFGPERTPPDDPIDDWPVFLGSVTRRRQDDRTPTRSTLTAGRMPAWWARKSGRPPVVPRSKWARSNRTTRSDSPSGSRTCKCHAWLSWL